MSAAIETQTYDSLSGIPRIDIQENLKIGRAHV